MARFAHVCTGKPVNGSPMRMKPEAGRNCWPMAMGCSPQILAKAGGLSDGHADALPLIYSFFCADLVISDGRQAIDGQRSFTIIARSLVGTKSVGGNHVLGVSQPRGCALIKSECFAEAQDLEILVGGQDRTQIIAPLRWNEFPVAKRRFPWGGVPNR